MTTITKEITNYHPYQGGKALFVVRSTDLPRPETFYWLSDAIAFCRHIGLPYHVN